MCLNVASVYVEALIGSAAKAKLFLKSFVIGMAMRKSHICFASRHNCARALRILANIGVRNPSMFANVTRSAVRKNESQMCVFKTSTTRIRVCRPTIFPLLAFNSVSLSTLQHNCNCKWFKWKIWPDNTNHDYMTVHDEYFLISIHPDMLICPRLRSSGDCRLSYKKMVKNPPKPTISIFNVKDDERRIQKKHKK